MNAKLLISIVLLITQAALAQGTFTYTFSGDNSPWKVSATFQASEQAVATGILTETNIIGGYLLQGGNQWSIYELMFAVDSLTGKPSGTNPFDTYIITFHQYDEIDIDGGLTQNPYTMIVYYPYIGSPSNFSGSNGRWHVNYNVPEPNSITLLVLALAGMAYARRAGRTTT